MLLTIEASQIFLVKCFQFWTQKDLGLNSNKLTFLRLLFLNRKAEIRTFNYEVMLLELKKLMC